MCRYENEQHGCGRCRASALACGHVVLLAVPDRLGDVDQLAGFPEEARAAARRLAAFRVCFPALFEQELAQLRQRGGVAASTAMNHAAAEAQSVTWFRAANNSTVAQAWEQIRAAVESEADRVLLGHKLVLKLAEADALQKLPAAGFPKEAEGRARRLLALRGAVPAQYNTEVATLRQLAEGTDTGCAIPKGTQPARFSRRNEARARR